MAFKSILSAICACLIIISFNANAALVGRLALTEGGTDYQAYYDTEADLTWLADAKASVGSSFATGYIEGTMPWANANAWAASLNINGIDGWRLPETLDPDMSCDDEYGGVFYGDNCTGSEFGNLFYNVLGNTANIAYDLINDGPFNFLGSSGYWTATETHNPFTNVTNHGFYFSPSGYQSFETQGWSFHAWAVHDGDVGAVPIPSAVWLFGSGLIGLIGLARRKKA